MSLLPTFLLTGGLLLLFVAERILGDGTGRTVTLAVAALSFAAAAGLRVARRGQARGDAQRIETWLLVATAGVLAALGLFWLSTPAGLEALGQSGEGAERVSGVLYALFPALLVVSYLSLVFGELAYAKMPVAEAVELRRARTAMQLGASLSLALVFLFSLNYVAKHDDVKKDLSYFKTTRPSDATLRMVKSLGEPIEIVLFYPKVNDVLEQLRPYFEAIDRASDKVEVSIKDHALSPKLARQHRVRGNGQIVLLKGEGDAQQAETFEVGTELEVARSRLRTLDGRFQQSFSKLTRVRREVYLTTGHDERTSGGADGDPQEERVKAMDDALRRANVTTRPLGVGQGLANEVPEGAPAVMIVGPRKAFLPEEAEALLRYVKRGGRVFAMIDPDAPHGLDPFLAGLGLAMKPGVAASEGNHLQRTFTPADRVLLVTSRYSSHPTVTLPSRHSTQVATIFVGGGALEEAGQKPHGAKTVFPIRSASQIYRDLDGDYERDENEPMEDANFMAAVSVPVAGKDEGRAVIVADGAFLTDQVIQNPGNALVFSDVANWLLGEEQIVGDTTSEEDVRIEHTRDEDKALFYLTSFGIPVPILGAGVFIAARRRRGGKRETHGKAGRAPSGGGPKAGGETAAQGGNA